MATVQQNTNVVQSTVGTGDASAALKTGDSNQKEIDNLINDLSSLAALVNKALQLIRESIQEWRDTLSNGQAKGMQLMLTQAVDNNASQKDANQKEQNAANMASWTDLASGLSSFLGAAFSAKSAETSYAAGKIGTAEAKLYAQFVKDMTEAGIKALDGGVNVTKFWVTRASAEITRKAKDESADVQLQNKILEAWEKQIGQIGQRLGEMQGQLSSVNDQLRQSVGQLYYSLAQQ